MKKISAMLCLLATLLVMSVAQASSLYEDYYNGDENYPLIWGHMGTAIYLDKSSLVCQDYEPPCYTLAINIISVDNADRGNREISRITTLRFFYNWNDRKMYIDQKTGTSSWRYLKPTGSNAESGMVMYAGEAAFYLDYGKKFYGSRTWYDSFLNRNVTVFNDSFYTKL